MNPFAEGADDEANAVLDAMDFATLEILDNYDGSWSVRVGDRDVADCRELYFANVLAGALVGGAYGKAAARGDRARMAAIVAAGASSEVVRHVVDAIRRTGFGGVA